MANDQKKKLLAKQQGFTLIELLVVIAIIGLLSTIAFVSLNRARVGARDAKRIADVQQIQKALELFYSDQSPDGYPWDTLNTVGRGRKISSTILPAQYVASVPVSPQPPESTLCTGQSTFGSLVPSTQRNEYIYVSKMTDTTTDCTAAPCPWYRLYFCTGSNTGGLSAGEHYASPSGIQ